LSVEVRTRTIDLVRSNSGVAAAAARVDRGEYSSVAITTAVVTVAVAAADG